MIAELETEYYAVRLSHVVNGRTEKKIGNHLSNTTCSYVYIAVIDEKRKRRLQQD